MHINICIYNMIKQIVSCYTLKITLFNQNINKIKTYAMSVLRICFLLMFWNANISKKQTLQILQFEGSWF
jgi:hypothetical protein